MSAAAVTDEPSSAAAEIELAVRGMTCAACAARVERKLNSLDAVSATVNFATERATVLAPPSVTTATLITAVEQAGYGAVAVRPRPGTAAEAAASADAAAAYGDDFDQAAYLRRRLILAAIFFFPLSDISMALSLFPSFRFPDWQWVLIVLAAPVVGWAAWPFHRAAWRGLRHGTLSMDTLVSLGITASCGWSLYAMFVLDAGAQRSSARYELLHASGGGI
jgi:P-type Cu+ transporter